MDEPRYYGKDLVAFEAARERGYLGGVRTVATRHVSHLIRSAIELVNLVDNRTFPEPPPGGECEGSGPAERTLERAVNLLRHAAAELEDERLRLRDGWPQ